MGWMRKWTGTCQCREKVIPFLVLAVKWAQSTVMIRLGHALCHIGPLGFQSMAESELETSASVTAGAHETFFSIGRQSPVGSSFADAHEQQTHGVTCIVAYNAARESCKCSKHTS